MREIIIKAFGYLEPVNEVCLQELHNLCSSWYLDENIFRLEDNGLHIYHEGEYFPHEDITEILAKYLQQESLGKLDIIDYEAWTLQRYFFEFSYQKEEDLKKGKIYSRSSSLDHALEASQEKNGSVIIK